MIKHTNENDFNKDVIENKKLVIIDFFATWCMPCQMLAPIFEEVSNRYEDIDFFKIDIDQNPNLVKQFEIDSVPTLVFMKEGKVLNQEIGVRGLKEFDEIIQKLK